MNAVDLEEDVTRWLVAISGEERGDLCFGEWLEDGKILCKAANKIKPGICPKISNSKKGYKQIQNISCFLKAATDVGVPQHSLFNPSDLTQLKDMLAVLRCVYLFMALAQETHPSGGVPGVGTMTSKSGGRFSITAAESIGRQSLISKPNISSDDEDSDTVPGQSMKSMATFKSGPAEFPPGVPMHGHRSVKSAKKPTGIGNDFPPGVPRQSVRSVRSGKRQTGVGSEFPTGFPMPNIKSVIGNDCPSGMPMSSTRSMKSHKRNCAVPMNSTKSVRSIKSVKSLASADSPLMDSIKSVASWKSRRSEFSVTLPDDEDLHINRARSNATHRSAVGKYSFQDLGDVHRPPGSEAVSATGGLEEELLNILNDSVSAAKSGRRIGAQAGTHDGSKHRRKSRGGSRRK